MRVSIDTMDSNEITIEMVLGAGTNKYNYIRRHARQKFIVSKKITKCMKCPYDKHIEVAHIKAIKDFPLDTPINIVNAEENILLLCPNCHWEFDHGNDYLKKTCPQCHQKKHKQSSVCRKCAQANGAYIKKNCKRIPKDELVKLLNEFPMTTIGKMLKVSGNSVKKWCDYYGILLGDRRGYWAKLYASKHPPKQNIKK